MIIIASQLVKTVETDEIQTSEDRTFKLIKIISRVVSTQSESMNAFWAVVRPGFVRSLDFSI